MQQRWTKRGLRAALLGVVLAAASGCLVIEHSDPMADVTLLWDFEGWDCIDAGVSRTAVEIYDRWGLLAEQTVWCDDAGVTFRDFDPGYYDYRLFGLSRGGRVLYEAVGGFDVYRGDNVFTIRLRDIR